MFAARLTVVLAGLLLLAAPSIADDPMGPFRLRSVISPRGLQTFRWNRLTGAASKLESDTWQRIAETDKPPEGIYDLVLVASTETWMVYRIETGSGQTWAAFASGRPRELEWRLLKEMPPAAAP